MGNNISDRSQITEKSCTSKERTNKVFFLLHRTWAIIVTEKWSKSRTTRTSNTNDLSSDLESQYSFCSCSQCHRDEGNGSVLSSDLFGSEMSPNSEETTRINNFAWGEENIAKEKQRAPIYNPEDYALSLKKWGRKPPPNGPGLYTSGSAVEADITRAKSHSFRDYRNPMLSENEMTLRQFGTVSELLCKLKSDLKLSYASFVQEFVADPLDGATLLLDVLRIIQLSQANNGSNGTTGTTGRIPPSVQRRALLDELSCLQCLMYCASRYGEAIRKITTSSAGLFTLSVCIMSNVTKSRIIALQLLTKICSLADIGHTAVSEALSTLRLRFGEPVRFRFLVGMLSSTGGHGELLATGLNFLNSFMDQCGTAQKRLFIQAELFQAGLDIDSIKKNVTTASQSSERIFRELEQWEKNYIDIEEMTTRLRNLETENDNLRDKTTLLERKVQILQEEKGILVSLEQCLKERCSELQGEVMSLKSVKNTSKSSRSSHQKRDRSSPAHDEGISSSERSLTPEDLQKDSSLYEIYSVHQGETLPMAKKKPLIEDEEEETTIEEVMEELNNIINNAETQDLREREQKKLLDKERIKMEEAQVKSKLQRTNLLDDSHLDYESEIIPTNLNPQPPRKARSMVHLYIPTEDYDCPKEIFFENAFSSEEGSDSLLSASKCVPKYNRNAQIKVVEEKKIRQNEMVKSESFRYQNMAEVKAPVQEPFLHRSNSHIYSKKIGKSKSLDRIDDGLDAMVDIVVTEKIPMRTNRSDTGNVTTTMVNTGLSHVKLSKCLSQQNLERNKMFLPPTKFQYSDTHYYFPRIQEKRNSSFLVKRPNAGLYSGQVVNNKTKKTEYFASIGSKNSSGRLTDMPSGLY